MVVRIMASAIVLCLIAQTASIGISGNGSGVVDPSHQLDNGPEAAGAPTSSDEVPAAALGQVPIFEEEEDSHNLLLSDGDLHTIVPSAELVLDVETLMRPGIGSRDLFRPPRVS